MLEVENLTKRYGAFAALDGVSFRARHGRVLGFLGPNGAGKSTTMKIVTGFGAKSGGSVRVCGLDADENPREVKRHIGFLPEDTPLPAHMTVMELLEYASDLKRLPKRERAAGIAKIVEMTGISHVCGRLIRNLSKGYRQRVGIARALIGFPEVLILDEPTSGLDPSQLIEIRALVRELGKSHTLIFSSHILSEVESVCDDVVIIHRGRVLASGTPAELTGAGGGSKYALTLGEGANAAAVLAALAGFEGVELSPVLPSLEDAFVRLIAGASREEAE
ncbi:MAG: ABC transporter ATP-binding protein [Clostridiales Family XIII bacterium]|jgi:ABC-2 type transport system ATP-binding protein|nr:ABC transporter ATP-binding protein [Clostridiales Family XIII bacterium]